MDDILGTSIQFAEQQIRLLEQEHEEKVQKTVDDLIANGFLDSDYDGSSGDFSSSEDEEESESEFSDLDLVIDNGEIEEYVVFEEIDHFDYDDEISQTYPFDDFAAHDSVNDPKYQFFVYQRVVVDIDYDFYSIDNELISF